MHDDIFLISGKICVGCRIRVVPSLVDLRGRDPVHDHLRQVIHWHLHADDLPVVLRCGHIGPVLEVMLISPLVMEPCGGISLFFLLRRVWTPRSLIILHAGLKFLPGILRQIVEQPLFKKSNLKAAFHDHQLVMGDGQKVMPGVVEQPFFFLIQFNRTHIFTLSLPS